MKGFGRRIKRAYRAANEQWQLAGLDAHDRQRLLMARYIEQSSFDVDYFFHIVPDRKALFIEVPKNASSFILTELAKLSGTSLPDRHAAHRRTHSGLQSPRLYGWDKFIDLALDPELTSFAVVRNPYERLLSCYLDKFTDVPIGNGSYISDTVVAYSRLAGLSFETGTPLSFAEFVRFACATASIAFDGHWAPQSRIIPQTLLAPKHLLRFESLGRDLVNVFLQIGAPADQVAGLDRQHAPTAADRLVEAYTPELKALVGDAYRADFLRFGYDL